MISSIFSILLLAFSSTTLSAPSMPYRYYLKARFSTSNDHATPLYISSSITFNGHTNYVLVTSPTLANPLSVYDGDGRITLDTSNVIGASSEGPLLLSNNDGLNGIYKQVILGDEMSGEYTKGFKINADHRITLDKEGFGGFVACTAARGVKQVYWFRQGEVDIDGQGHPVVCEEVEFERVWNLNGTLSA
ncbi:uncharacterized protein BDV17DRAFT_272272 [Aspergillus undulatus]|uniref:uncharacterized protein n=1 Tax=Aspergillus undulatus TaxID=1810928 RepID=UPI003CCD6555